MVLAVAAVVFASLFGHHAPRHPVQRSAFTRRIDGWTLGVRRDAFAASALCRLTRGRAAYDRGVVVFRLSPGTDTSAAVYRIDDGPPRPVTADQMAVASLGLPIWQDDLDNPSGGVVRIPAGKLAGARLVRIETRLNGHVWRARVDHLDAALEASREAGCP
jgi:hypothetical protein